ncbi:MAG: hypothetical protein JW891_14975 [Candidatus Lokiarchaeota archaeon]|nr:hypothetical protein [Candidatus Lokiarchaeota archaeon]
MTNPAELKKLFNTWQELNEKVGASFGDFDFNAIKDIRKNQREIEDKIYSILLKNANEELKKDLPDDCGEMEIGYESEEQKFYFLMFDPNQEFENEDEPARITAIVFSADKQIEIIEDFKDSE